MKRIFCLFLIACLPLLANSQTITHSADRYIYSVKQLRTDFVYFKNALESAHPSLYRYHPKDSLDVWFIAALEKIDHPMGDIEFWALLESVITKIGSGHTNISVSDAVLDKLRYGEHKSLPFSVYVRDNRIYFKGFYSKSDSKLLKTGGELLAINDESATKLLQQLRNLIPGDGYSNAFKDFRLEQNGFASLYNWLHGDLPEYKIAYKNSGDTIKTETIKAITYTSKKPEKNDKDKTYSFTGSTSIVYYEPD